MQPMYIPGMEAPPPIPPKKGPRRRQQGSGDQPSSSSSSKSELLSARNDTGHAVDKAEDGKLNFSSGERCVCVRAVYFCVF